MEGLSCLNAAQALRRESLQFITNSPREPGTHLMDLVVLGPQAN